MPLTIENFYTQRRVDANALVEIPPPKNKQKYMILTFREYFTSDKD